MVKSQFQKFGANQSKFKLEYLGFSETKDLITGDVDFELAKSTAEISDSTTVEIFCTLLEELKMEKILPKLEEAPEGKFE